ncbi:multidrug efflux pump subunit AcrB [Sinobacterium caligoides]|uniref:Multidrug efflux pump subunit AcrB n=1 Tax=Sinobacterium caligoides TaxID=933926 RepID=A0A3N2DXT6_9GAMM|nr:efflux RND transporter permease subunit [Sinobacterium caligoides]ROS04680.1 multidrug efflux pump subunit AcrB [Sinobacterium caligoides]
MSEPRRGPIAWMIQNKVSSNLLMLVLILGGLAMSGIIKKEVFPTFDTDYVTVKVSYPGSSPAEIEQGIVLAVEEVMRGVEGIKEVTSTARQGSAVINGELTGDGDRTLVYQDIQQAVSGLSTLPDGAESPVVSMTSRRFSVLKLVLHGDLDNWVLREVIEDVRDQLLQSNSVSDVELQGGSNYEVQVEITRETLERYKLQIDDVARRIRSQSVELPGGSIDSRAGEIMVRVSERAEWADQFSKIPIVTHADGSYLTLGDIATVRDDFSDNKVSFTYNEEPSVSLQVYGSGDQDPLSVSAAVHDKLASIRASLPPGVSLDVLNDRSDLYQGRLDLLLKNAFMGLLLVLVLLGIFLDIRLAFWVTLGIPTSFLGAMLFLPLFDVTLNMVSMFAFILALGIVVDDAIIAGENIHEYRKLGYSNIQAAIEGIKSVAVPLTFSILSNIIAFIPLYFLPGFLGKLFGIVPLVVASVFIISWVEALFILPAHLAHSSEKKEGRWFGRLHRRQQRLSEKLTIGMEHRYSKVLAMVLNYRYLTVALGVFVFVVVMAYAMSGRMGFTLMPRVESDRAAVTAVLPVGSPMSSAIEVRDSLIASANKMIDEYGREQLIRGVRGEIKANQVEVVLQLNGEGVRPVSTGQVVKRWRELTGDLAGVDSLKFESDRGGPGRGAALTIELSHRDDAVLQQASSELAASLGTIAGVSDITDGYSQGKPQLDVELLARGEALGLTNADVAGQLRSAFYGSEALRQQRGRHEVKVKVRLKEQDRLSIYDLEQLQIVTPDGDFVPLNSVAKIHFGHAYTDITRRGGRRTINVTANVEPIENTSAVLVSLNSGVLQGLQEQFPALMISYRGKQQDTQESASSLMVSSLLTLGVLYVMLAIPFGSYSQPLLVMLAIPFGVIGAIIGHKLMGFGMSMISILGILALSGVVVNDTLVMLDYANKQRAKGAEALQAISLAGVRRFRPIVLTTLTTFGGLAPMIFETSRQAKFLIPMAISLGYGILFSTVICLLLVPAMYMVLEDAGVAMGRLRRFFVDSRR